MFSSCLSRCRLNCFIVNIFVDKLQGCYRDGLERRRRHEELFKSLLYPKDGNLPDSVYQSKDQSRSSYRSFAGAWISAGTVFFIMA